MSDEGCSGQKTNRILTSCSGGGFIDTAYKGLQDMKAFYPYWLSYIVTSWETYWYGWKIQLIVYFRLRKIQAIKFT